MTLLMIYIVITYVSNNYFLDKIVQNYVRDNIVSDFMFLLTRILFSLL